MTTSFINFNLDGSLPEIFNPLIIKNNNIQASTISTQDLSSTTLSTGLINISSLAQYTNNNITRNSNELATTAYVDKQISDLIGSAPDLLNTLQEIDQALNNDPNFSTTMTNQLATKGGLDNVNTWSQNNNFSQLTINGTDLYTRLLTDATNISTNTNNITINTNNIATNTTDINNLKNRMTTAEGNITTNTNDITTNTNNITTNTNNIATNTNNIATNASNITSLQNRMTTAEGNINTNTNNISTNTTSINNLNKKVLSANSWYVNSGESISSVLSQIGSSQAQTVFLTSGGFNHSSDQSGITFSNQNFTICGPDSALTSSSTVIYPDITISGSLTTRCRFSNIQFGTNVNIVGTQGRHNFKGCTFQNLTVSGSTTNWLIFQFCSFSGAITLPSTFAGVVYFQACDFSGSSFTLNQSSSAQCIFTMATGLPSLSLKASFLSFNSTADLSSALSTNNLNVTSAVSFPTGSVSIASVNNLQTSLDAKVNKSDVSTRTLNDRSNTNIATTNYVDLSLDALRNGVSSQFDTLQELAQAVTQNTSDILTKANDNAVVHLSGSETVAGVKTFTNGLKTNQTLNANDNSTNVASTQYVDQAIANLINGAPSTMDTLSEIATILQQDVNNVNTILSTMVNLSGNQNISGVKTFTNGAKSGQTLLQGDNSTNVATTSYVDTGLSNKLDKSNPTFTGTLTGQSIVDNGSFTASGNTSLGTTSANTLTVKSTSTFQSPVICSSTLSLNGSDLNTRITNDEIAITNLQTAVAGKQNTLTFDTTPTQNSSNSMTSGSIYSTLQNYALSSVLSSYQTISGMSSYLTSSTAASTYQTISGMSSYLTTSSASSTYQTLSGMSSYLTTSSASSTYQTLSGMASYLTTSSAASTYAPLTNAALNINQLSENINSSITVTSNALSVNYSSNQGIFNITPSSANNMSLAVSNIPTSNQNASYTLTFLINTSTNKQYINAITVNGTSYTMISGGGLANISVNSGASRVMQSFNIMFLNSATPIVVTNVISLY